MDNVSDVDALIHKAVRMMVEEVNTMHGLRIVHIDVDWQGRGTAISKALGAYSISVTTISNPT